MSSEMDGFGDKWKALHVGVVTENADPDLLGRVKIRVPGLVEPSTDWALPLGNPGGGGMRRGLYAPPPVGAEVGVFFAGGEVDRPYFLPGNYGLPGGVRETPGPVGGYAPPTYLGEPGAAEEIAPEDAPLVKSFESDDWVIVLDDRPGKSSAKLENKVSGDHILMLGKPRYATEIRVTGTLRIVAEGQLDLQSNNITFNGVPFLNDGKPR